MKKFLLSIICMFSLIAINAEEVSITFSEQGYTNGQEVTTVKLDDNITLTFDKGTNNNTPKYYTTGTAVRIYGGGTLTIAGSSDAVTINTVTITSASSNTVNSASTVTNGELTISGTTATISDVDASETVFTQGGTSGHVRIQTLTVNYTLGVATSAATPEFSVASGEISADTEIGITCSTDGASIYYTIDGTDPSETNGTLYEAPFTLAADATVKAIAVAANLSNSSIATATYTFPVANIAAFIEAANSKATTISGTVTVVAQSGSYLFLEDATGKIIAYGSLTNTYNNGDQLTGVKGTYTLYNGLPEMNVEASSFGTATAGTAVEPTTIALSELASTELLTYVKVTGVTIPESSSKSYTITDESGSATMYNSAGITVTTGENLTVVGFISCYGTTMQLLPVEITSASGEEVVTAPVIDPNGGTIATNTEISITCDTDGASIYYTIDGTDPSETNGTLYEAPFTLAADATVKAIAVATGMANSSITEAAFTLMSANLKVVTFDFTDPSGLNPVQETPATSAEISVDGVTFTNGAISITFNNGTSSNNCRLWGTSSGVELRTYNGSYFTVTASNATITNITFTGNKASASQLTADSGTFTSKTWTSDAVDATATESSVVFTATATTNIETITVTYDTTVGVEAVGVDANAPVEYYNLQGVKVENPAGGLFIKRQGTTATKVIL